MKRALIVAIIIDHEKTHALESIEKIDFKDY
jgi:hypothetical protein